MGFTVKERDRRFEAVRGAMRKEGIGALLLFGSTGVGGQWNGNFTYLSNYSLIFATGLVVFPLEGSPAVFLPGENQWIDAMRAGWIGDTRLSKKPIEDACRFLKGHKPAAGKVGVSSLDALPALALAYLEEQFPKESFVEAASLVVSARNRKSAEAGEPARAGATAADAGYARGLEILRPGLTERGLFAEMERVMTSAGAGAYFDMLGAGRGTGDEDAFRGFVIPPTSRAFQKGDLALLEITPRVDGYWNQIVRLVSFGKPPDEAGRAHAACLEAKHAALRHMRPGEDLADMARAAQKVLEGHGYAMKDVGSVHTTGLDLSELLIMTSTEMRAEEGMLITLHPMIATGEWRQLFIGETYVITADGYERLNHCPEEIAVIGG
ncbi:MAG: M24 family metallopeptidase [Nitrospinota bacterium]